MPNQMIPYTYDPIDLYIKFTLNQPPPTLKPLQVRRIAQRREILTSLAVDWRLDTLILYRDRLLAEDFPFRLPSVTAGPGLVRTLMVEQYF